MIDFAWSEFMVLAVVALVFLGPKELVILCRTLGRWAAKLHAVQKTFQDHLHQASLEIDREEEAQKAYEASGSPLKKSGSNDQTV